MRSNKIENSKVDDMIPIIVQGLGGKTNIVETENCFTRLRVMVKDPTAVNANAIDKAGSYGVLQSGADVHIVYGTAADKIEKKLREYLEKE